MKKLMFILLLLIVAIGCKEEEIIPVKETNEYVKDTAKIIASWSLSHVNDVPFRFYSTFKAKLTFLENGTAIACSVSDTSSLCYNWGYTINKEGLIVMISPGHSQAHTIVLLNDTALWLKPLGQEDILKYVKI